MSDVALLEDEGVFYITLDRPAKHNAFTPEMIEAITTGFKKAAEQPQVRAVMIRGEGPSFCAGADLAWMKSMADFSPQENIKDAEKLFEMFEAAKLCPLPVIGRFQGSVFGGGLGLATVCDISAAEDNARFCFSEVRLGLVPAVISPFVFSKVSASVAKEWMLTGRRFEAPEALTSGLIQHCGTAVEVDAYIEKQLDHIFKCGPEALRETKGLLNSVSGEDWKKLKKETTRVIAERRQSAEGQEGMQAFFNKSPANWIHPR